MEIFNTKQMYRAQSGMWVLTIYRGNVEPLPFLNEMVISFIILTWPESLGNTDEN